MTRVEKLTTSGLFIALYVVIMYFTQAFAFGAYQIRIATALYAAAYVFPFLAVPLGMANFLSNLLLGGMGILDIVGGTFVGIITSSAISQVAKRKLPEWLIIVCIIAGPGLIVPIWLSIVLAMPYSVLAVSLCIGQSVPAVVGYLGVRYVTEKRGVVYHE